MQNPDQSASPDLTDIAVIEWIEPRALVGYSLVCGFFVVCGTILMLTMIVGLDRYEAGGTALWYILGGPAVFFAVAILIGITCAAPAYLRQRRLQCAESRAWASGGALPPDADDSRVVLAGAISRASICAGRRLEGEPRLPGIVAALNQRGLQVPRVILDRSVAEAVLAIERTPHLLEPESIDSRGTWMLALLSWLWLPGLIALYWIAGRESLPLAVFIAIGTLTLAFRIIRAFKFGVVPGSTGLVAGVGYLEGPTGVRLSSGKVVTLICKARLQPMRVRILAPDWNFELRFTSPRDPGFIDFWQRWNHPHPRPELVEDRGGV